MTSVNVVKWNHHPKRRKSSRVSKIKLVKHAKSSTLIIYQRLSMMRSLNSTILSTYEGPSGCTKVKCRSIKASMLRRWYNNSSKCGIILHRKWPLSHNTNWTMTTNYSRTSTPVELSQASARQVSSDQRMKNWSLAAPTMIVYRSSMTNKRRQSGKRAQ